MKSLYSQVIRIVFFSLVIVILGPKAYADEVPSVKDIEAHFEHQLNTRFEPYDIPKATSYYDDLADHYEQVYLMSDVIDQGIR